MTARSLSPAQANLLRAICRGYFADRDRSKHKHAQTLKALRRRGFIDAKDRPTDAGRAVFPEFRPPAAYVIWHLTGPQGCGKTRFAELVISMLRERALVAVKVDEFEFSREFAANPARVADHAPSLAVLMVETNTLSADGFPAHYMRGDRVIDLTDFAAARRPEAIPAGILLRLDHPEWTEEAILCRAKAQVTQGERSPC